jgi:hypothetical protein
VILVHGVQLAVPCEDKQYQVYISGTTDHISVNCDVFGLTADVSNIKVPGDPLTKSTDAYEAQGSNPLSPNVNGQ